MSLFFFFFCEGWLCCGAISDATDSLPSYKDAMNTNRLHSVCCIKITYGEKNVFFHLKVTKTPLKRWRHRNMVLSYCPASEAKEEEKAEKFWTRWYFSSPWGSWVQVGGEQQGTKCWSPPGSFWTLVLVGRLKGSLPACALTLPMETWNCWYQSLLWLQSACFTWDFPPW